MLQFELSETALIDEDHTEVPSEGELLAITLGLLAAEGRNYSELKNTTLRLTRENLGRVVEFVAYRLPMLLSEFKDEDVGRRLSQFVGLKVQDV